MTTHPHKEYLITHFIIIVLTGLVNVSISVNIALFISFVLLGIDVAVLYDLLDQHIHQYNLLHKQISNIPLRINVGVLWLIPFASSMWLFLGGINYYVGLAYVIILLATILTTTLWSIPQFKKLGLSRIWSLFIYIPIIRLWVLHITIKALNEKIKEAQLN